MLPAGKVLDQAHHEAVLLRCGNHDGGDLRLPETDEGLETALSAHKVVSGLALPLRNRDRFLEPEPLCIRVAAVSG